MERSLVEVAVRLIVAALKIDTSKLQLFREAWKRCSPVEISKVAMLGLVGKDTSLQFLLHALPPRLMIVAQILCSYLSQQQATLHYSGFSEASMLCTIVS
jgi:hypothetical protein